MAILYSSRMTSLSFFESIAGYPQLISGWGIDAGNAVTCCQASTGGRTLPDMISELHEGTIRWQYGYFCYDDSLDFTRTIAEFNCDDGAIGSTSNRSFLSALDLNTDGSLTYRPNANLVTPVTFTSAPGVFLRNGTIQALQFRFSFPSHDVLEFNILINNVSVLADTATAVGAINCTIGTTHGPISSTPRWARRDYPTDSSTICEFQHQRTGINHYAIKHFRTGSPIIASSSLVEVIIDDSGAPVSYTPGNAIPVIQEPCFVVVGVNSLTVTKVSSPTSGSTSFPFTTIGGLVPPSFALTEGQSQVYTDVDPGVYSILETSIPAPWTPAYEVSTGGTDNLNITVEEDSHIVLTVTNSMIGDIGGMYFINPTKATKHDSYYNSVEKKIPNPTIKTALIGD